MLIKINRKQKDASNRNRFKASELKRRYYNYMKINAIKDKNNQNYLKYHNLLAALPKTIITNYCYITGRSRGVYKKFRMSRHQIREKFRYLNGLMNSSW